MAPEIDRTENDKRGGLTVMVIIFGLVVAYLAGLLMLAIHLMRLVAAERSSNHTGGTHINRSNQSALRTS